MHVYRLSAAQAESFRAEGRLDPFTRSPFEVGDRIVFCENERVAYRADTWQIRNRCPNEECGCSTTTRFPRSRPEFRLRRRWTRFRAPAPPPTTRARPSFWQAAGGLAGLLAAWLLFCSPSDQGPARAPGTSASAAAASEHAVSSLVMNVNLRRSPGHLGKRRTDVIRSVPTGSALAVIEGPRDADGLRWWKVRCLGSEGWMAERTESGAAIIVAREPR